MHGYNNRPKMAYELVFFLARERKSSRLLRGERIIMVRPYVPGVALAAAAKPRSGGRCASLAAYDMRAA